MRPPICVRCQLSMTVTKTGQIVELMTDESEYQLWSADLYQCRGCKTQIVANYGNSPIAESHSKTYYASRKIFEPIIQYWRTWTEKVRYHIYNAEPDCSVCAACGKPVHIIVGGSGQWSHIHSEEFTQCRNNWAGPGTYAVRPVCRNVERPI